MKYAIHDDIRFCVTNGRTAFLDLRTDRYFCLPPTSDQVFQRFILGEPVADADQAILDRLFRSGLFTDVQRSDSREDIGLPTPARGLTDLSGLHSLKHTFQALYCYGNADREVRRHRLKQALDRITDSRNRGQPATREGLAEQEKLSAQFSSVGRLVKRQDKCLVWSLAEIRFLAGHNFHPHLVIGVKLEPFGAHAWVQSGETVLSCTLEETRHYTPILVA